MPVLKLPDYNGGFITKGIEGGRVVTRDDAGNILADKPVNYIRKGIKTNFGYVVNYSDSKVIIKSGIKTIEADRHLLNLKLATHFSAHSQADNSLPIFSGTFGTPIGNVFVENVTDDIRHVMVNPDKIVHHTTYSIFEKSIGEKLIKATVEEPLLKRAFLKSIGVQTKGKPIKLFKSTARIFDISKTGTGGIAWNTKGGMRPDHKYIERKPAPNGEGYIYLYELPSGKSEWRDKEGNVVDQEKAEKEYNIDFKIGDAVRIGNKIGKIVDSSDNFYAVNVEGKMQTINKTEHLRKLTGQKTYTEGGEIDYKGKRAKILKLTNSLALIKENESGRITVIPVEQPIAKVTAEEELRQRRQSIGDKYSHVYQGYSEEDHYYNLDYDKQPEYQNFLRTTEEQGFGQLDDLTKQKFIKVGNETNSVTWKYNPETRETEFLINGIVDYPLYYAGVKYFVRDVNEGGYSLENAKTGERGLFLSADDYRKFKQGEYQKEKADEIVNPNADPYGGRTIGKKENKISFKPEYTEEEIARFNRKSYGVRWAKAQQAKQTAEQMKAENEQKKKELKEKLNSAEYKNFEKQIGERGYKLSENVFIAKKEIEIEGRKFKLIKRFDGNTEVEGQTENIKLGNDTFPITDITKDKIFYNENGEEQSKTIDELKEINGKNIFEPTRASKGVVSNIPAQKIYFGTEDKDSVSGYYEVVEADELVPSNFAGGEQNPKYAIGNAQNRDRSSRQSVAQIEKIANNPNFDFVSDDKTAQNGAPIVDQDYNVIAGNGRALGLMKHYELGQNKYRDDLLKNTERLGFDADEIAKMKNPVLVRRTNMGNEEAQRLGAISNQDQKLALEERETAKGMATRIDDATFNKISDMFSNAKGDFNSISDYLEAVGENLVKELVRKNIILENEQHLYFDIDSGKLNASHKDKLKQLLTQSILGDSSAAFEKIPDAARQGVTKSLGDIFSLKGKPGDLVPHVEQAVKLLSKYEAMKDNFKGPDDFLSQAANDAFEPLSADKKTLAVFDLLTSTKPNEIKDKIREYKLVMEPDMFGEGLEPEAAFDKVFAPKYEKGINKSLLGKIKIFASKPFGLMKGLILKSVTASAIKEGIRINQKKLDRNRNVLLPSKKNPAVRRWQTPPKSQEGELDDKQAQTHGKKVEGYPKELSKDEMMDFIEKNKLHDGFGRIDYQGAKEISGAGYNFVLKEIPIDKFDWIAEPRKRKNNLPVIARDLGDGDFEILDGKHRIGEAKARGEKTILAYVGVNKEMN